MSDQPDRDSPTGAEDQHQPAGQGEGIDQPREIGGRKRSHPLW